MFILYEAVEEEILSEDNIFVVLSSCIDGNVVNCEVASVEVTGNVAEYS